MFGRALHIRKVIANIPDSKRGEMRDGAGLTFQLN